MNDRRQMITMMGAAMLAAKSASGEMTAETFIKGREQATHRETGFGHVYMYHQGETGQSKLLETLQVWVDPGKSPHPPHKHPEEEILLALEGEGEFIVNGEATKFSGQKSSEKSR